MLPTECPVSLQPFEEPRVLECGHTIDGSVIQKLPTNTCPVCRLPFFHDPPINWALVKIMDLHLPSPVDKNINPFRTAKIMKRQTNDVVARIAADNIPLLLNKINHASRMGLYEIVITTSDLRVPFYVSTTSKQNVIKKLEKDLLRMGFRLCSFTLVDWFGCWRRNALRVWWNR